MGERKPQILIAIENLGGGGAERVALDIAQHWPRDDHDPVLLLGEASGSYRDNVPSDVEVLEIGVPSSPRRTLAFFARLRALLSERPVAGIVSHLTGMNRMLLRARLAGVVRAPVAVVEHNDFQSFLDQQNSAIRAAVLKTDIGYLYRRADAVVGCGAGVARSLGRDLGIPAAKLHAIPNPISARFLDTSAEASCVPAWLDALPRPITVSVGRMVEEKAFGDLIAAFARGLPGSLLILGEGPLRAELEGRVQQFGLRDRVFMPGFLDRPEQVLRVCDLYASSSVSEGYPLSLVEAYASGLPVVARDCDYGPREIVTPDRPGELVTSPSIEALAAAIARNLELTKRCAPGMRVDLTENLPETVARRYRALFP